MSLIANKDAISNIDAPTIIIKVISRNSTKNITTISGLFTYFGKEVHKRIISELGKKCAARATIIDSNKKEKMIQIQGDHREVIMDYLFQLYIPKEKIKMVGV